MVGYDNVDAQATCPLPPSKLLALGLVRAEIADRSISLARFDTGLCGLVEWHLIYCRETAASQI
jgi:hypothetical protein